MKYDRWAKVALLVVLVMWVVVISARVIDVQGRVGANEVAIELLEGRVAVCESRLDELEVKDEEMVEIMQGLADVDKAAYETVASLLSNMNGIVDYLKNYR